MPRARKDLREIRKRIAADAPLRAGEFVQRLRGSTQVLRQFPLIGEVVEEFGNPAIRQIFFGDYRIIYRYREPPVEILMVVHGAKLLHKSDIESK